MRPAISDTDILSAFGKVGRVDLLLAVFPKIYVAPAAYQELVRVDSMGFRWTGPVKQAVHLLPVGEGKLAAVDRLLVSFPQLGKGEIETMVLAEAHDLICLTNDRLAKRACKARSLVTLDLEEILRALKVMGIMARRELQELIELMEIRDHTRITAKDHILRD